MSELAKWALSLVGGLILSGGVVALLVSMDQLGHRHARPYHSHVDERGRRRPCDARPCRRWDAEQERAA